MTPTKRFIFKTMVLMFRSSFRNTNLKSFSYLSQKLPKLKLKTFTYIYIFMENNEGYSMGLLIKCKSKVFFIDIAKTIKARLMKVIFIPISKTTKVKIKNFYIHIFLTPKEKSIKIIGVFQYTYSSK